MSESDNAERVEILIAVIDEHLAAMQQALARAQYSYERLRALSADLKAATGSRSFVDVLDAAEAAKHRDGFPLRGG